MARPAHPVLSVERIVDEALALFDSGEDFSMRSLAKRLGVAAPSLYYHLDGLDHLVNLIRDRMVRDFPPLPPSPARPWRDEVESILRAMRDGYAAHPHLVAKLVSTPITSAPVLESYERMAVALRSAGFAAADVGVYLEVLDSFAIGIALERGAPSDVWHMTEATAVLAEANEAWPDPDARLDAAFELGLTALLDAIAARAAQ